MAYLGRMGIAEVAPFVPVETEGGLVDKDHIILIFVGLSILLFIIMTFRTFQDRPNRPFNDVP